MHSCEFTALTEQTRGFQDEILESNPSVCTFKNKTRRLCLIKNVSLGKFKYHGVYLKIIPLNI